MADIKRARGDARLIRTVGARVKDATGRTGTVVDVYRDYCVKVRFDGSTDEVRLSVAKLALDRATVTA